MADPILCTANADNMIQSSDIQSSNAIISNAGICNAGLYCGYVWILWRPMRGPVDPGPRVFGVKFPGSGPYIVYTSHKMYFATLEAWTPVILWPLRVDIDRPRRANVV